MYEWLTEEIRSIQSRRFHVFEPVSSAELEYRDNRSVLPLPPSFKAFLEQFGRAKLYLDADDVPKVAVYPLSPHRRILLDPGGVFVELGYFKAQSVYFQIESSAVGAKVFNLTALRVVEEGARFEDHAWTATPRTVADDFEIWLKTVCVRARSEYSKAGWQRVLSGPRPFTAKEQAIVDARRKFRWRVVGHTPEGNMLFEVSNGSDRVLPFLSVGVRGKGGIKLEGGVWLRTAGIQPGQTAVLEQDCYRKQLSPDEVEVFELPDPIPEKKERYWEFKAIGPAASGANANRKVD